MAPKPTEWHRDNFISKTCPEPNSGCLLWMGSYQRNGYGAYQMKKDGGYVTRIAHRAAWILFVGEIPEGKQINHKCDNRACVNVDHMTVGTQTDNLIDMARKGRNRTKLDETKVRAIILDRRTQREIAKDYNIGKSNIAMIKAGYNWKWIIEDMRAEGLIP
jgi:hypothetical protein